MQKPDEHAPGKELPQIAELPGQAEEAMEKKLEGRKGGVPLDVQDPLHEIETHQVELEIHSDELPSVLLDLKESPHLLSELYDFVPIGYFVFDRNGVIHFANNTGAGMIGQDKNGIIGKPFSTYIVKEDRDIFLEHLSGVFDREEKQTHELRVKSSDNAILHVQLQSVVSEKREGDPVFCRTAVTDITERVQVEEALRESEERLVLALSAGRFATWDLHASTGEIVWNDEHFKVMGYKPGEVKPSYQAWLDRVHPDDRSSIDTIFKRSLEESDNYHGEFRVIWPDSTVRWVESFGHLERDARGQAIRSYGVMIDITERKKVEQKILRGNETFHNLIENNPMGIYVIDADFKMRNASLGARRAFANVPKPLIGRDLTECLRTIWPEPFASEAISRFKHTLDTGEPYIAKDTVEQRRDIGEVEAYDWRIERITLPDGRYGVVCYYYDLTEQKKAEEALVQARAEAERRASELEAFVSSMSDGMALYDAVNNKVKVNEATNRMLGIPPDVPVEVWVKQYKLYNLDGGEIPLERWPSRRALSGAETRDARYRIVTPWKECVVSISAVPVVDTNGNIMGCVLSFRDNTNQLTIDQQKQDLYNRERRIASILQEALVPTTVYDIPGCDIAVRYEPALEEAQVGGDFYDVFDLGDGKVGILIGDVAGKGLAAAINVATARHSVRSYAYLDPRPAKVMTLVNDALCKNEDKEGLSMITAFFAVLDTRLGNITYTNAGHPFPFVLSSDGEVHELEITGRVLGVMPDFEYTEGGRTLDPRNIVVMFTDGITEARPGPKKFYGAEGVKDYLSSIIFTASPGIITEGLLESAKVHAGGSLSDDAAILAFRLKEQVR